MTKNTKRFLSNLSLCPTKISMPFFDFLEQFTVLSTRFRKRVDNFEIEHKTLIFKTFKVRDALPPEISLDL